MQDASWLSSLRNPGGRNRKLLQSALLITPPIVFILAGWRHRWIVDDGYIFLRVVDMITGGHGPVFNIGERVEAFSSVIWVFLLALADLVVPLRLEWIAVGTGIVLSAGGLALAIAGAARLARIYQPRALLLPFGILLPLAVYVAWRYASSGMETGLVLGWLGACLFVLARWADSGQRLSPGAAVLIGLGWLIRPELALFSALFVLTVVAMQWSNDSWRQRLTLLVTAGALPVSWQVFRMGYYGSLVPNPALTKDASSTHWGDGWLYLLDFANTYWLWLALLIVIMGGHLPMILGLWRYQARRALAVVGVFFVAAVLHTTYITAVGGDWLHGRLLLPAFYALALPAAVIPATRMHLCAVFLPPWVVFSAFALRPEPPNILQRFTQPTHNHVLIESRGWGEHSARQRRLGNEGFHMDMVLGLRFQRLEAAANTPHARLPGIAARALGASSYALGPDWHVIDIQGLAHPMIARFEVTPSLIPRPRRSGHKKPLPGVWLAAMVTLPDARVEPEHFPGMANPLIPDTSGERFQEQITVVREVLQCPALRELHEAVTAPLDARRFLSNFTGALARTRLTIPPDPHEAREKFCG